MTIKIILIAVFLIILIFMSKNERKKSKNFWKEWYINRKNFPLKYKGKTIWYSRSVAVALFAFAKNGEGKWCVLANKRGKGTPNFQSHWNCPCGYLDWNENGRAASIREAYEECGIKLDYNQVHFIGYNIKPDEATQNVTFRYGAILDKKSEEYEFSKKYNEKDEVDEIKWIPIEDIEQYTWAFNHLRLIPWAFKKIQEVIKNDDY